MGPQVLTLLGHLSPLSCFLQDTGPPAQHTRSSLRSTLVPCTVLLGSLGLCWSPWDSSTSKIIWVPQSKRKSVICVPLPASTLSCPRDNKPWVSPCIHLPLSAFFFLFFSFFISLFFLFLPLFFFSFFLSFPFFFPFLSFLPSWLGHCYWKQGEQKSSWVSRTGPKCGSCIALPLELLTRKQWT